MRLLAQQNDRRISMLHEYFHELLGLALHARSITLQTLAYLISGDLEGLQVPSSK